MVNTIKDFHLDNYVCPQSKSLMNRDVPMLDFETTNILPRRADRDPFNAQPLGSILQVYGSGPSPMHHYARFNKSNLPELGALMVHKIPISKTLKAGLSQYQLALKLKNWVSLPKHQAFLAFNASFEQDYLMYLFENNLICDPWVFSKKPIVDSRMPSIFAAHAGLINFGLNADGTINTTLEGFSSANQKPLGGHDARLDVLSAEALLDFTLDKAPELRKPLEAKLRGRLAYEEHLLSSQYVLECNFFHKQTRIKPLVLLSHPNGWKQSYLAVNLDHEMFDHNSIADSELAAIRSDSRNVKSVFKSIGLNAPNTFLLPSDNELAGKLITRELEEKYVRRIINIKSNSSLIAALQAGFRSRYKDSNGIRFRSRNNEDVARRFHLADPSIKWDLVKEFDSRYERELALQILWENWPEFLPKQDRELLEQRIWQSWHDPNSFGGTIAERSSQIEEFLRGDCSSEEHSLAKDYQDYLGALKKRGPCYVK